MKLKEETKSMPKSVEQARSAILQTLNSSALGLMISIGHRTALFDAMAGRGALDSVEVAALAGLNDRYVREWLNAMAVGGVVDTNFDGSKFELQECYANLLTRNAGNENLALHAQFIPCLAGIEEQILACFENGGGLAPSAFSRHEAIAAEECRARFSKSLRTELLPLFPELEARLADGIEHLDLGCGQGDLVLKFAAEFPKSKFLGVDSSIENIELARAKAQENSQCNAKFLVRDASLIDGQYDLVTAFSSMQKQPWPLAVLRRIHSCLKPNACLWMQIFGGSSYIQNNLNDPIAAFRYTLSCLSSMSLGMFSGGDGLGAMWGEEAAFQMLEQAGFESVSIKRLPQDFSFNYFLATKTNR